MAEVRRNRHAAGNEYASNIFNACFGDHTPYRFNANVLNHGSIANLPTMYVWRFPPGRQGPVWNRPSWAALPPHLAILVGHTAQMENLVVEAAMEKSKRKVREAVYMDPLCSAVCSLQEIDDMVDAIFRKNELYLGDYRD